MQMRTGSGIGQTNVRRIGRLAIFALSRPRNLSGRFYSSFCPLSLLHPPPSFYPFLVYDDSCSVARVKFILTVSVLRAASDSSSPDFHRSKIFCPAPTQKQTISFLPSIGGFLSIFSVHYRSLISFQRKINKTN